MRWCWSGPTAGIRSACCIQAKVEKQNARCVETAARVSYAYFRLRRYRVYKVPSIWCSHACHIVPTRPCCEGSVGAKRKHVPTRGRTIVERTVIVNRVLQRRDKRICTDRVSVNDAADVVGRGVVNYVVDRARRQVVNERCCLSQAMPRLLRGDRHQA